MTEFVFIYSTYPDSDSAAAIAEELVKAKRVACANIHAPMVSVYGWQGAIEKGSEVAMFLKTRRALVDEVIAMARKRHPYTVPCFLVLPIESGNDDYLAWVREQTLGG